MPDPTLALAEALLEEPVSCSARRNRKAAALLSLFLGVVAFAAFLSYVPISTHGGGQHLDRVITMANPFERMFFGGGGGNPFGGGEAPRRKEVDNTRFYKLLEVDKNANEAEIKKAYRKLAVKHHPDKGGDPEKFRDITRAYEVLSDKDKRDNYDRNGEEGLDNQGGGDPTDIFDAFFGGRGRGGKAKKKKTKDVTSSMKVTLEQLYKGVTKQMAVTRQVIDTARGVSTCSECKGKGVTVRVVQMGPMISQMQSNCEACDGQGKAFKRKSEREVLEVHIPRGSPPDHKVVFREKADEHPDHDTGDIVFVLKEQPHKEFKRRGADLFIERTISLVEALCGFELELTQLDGRKLLIKTEPGDIVCPAAANFDPLAAGESKAQEWECMEGYDCPSADNVAQAETSDIDTVKKAIETQLKKQGISVEGFVCDGRKTYFKSGTRAEILENKRSRSGCSLYVMKDPNANAGMRMVKAVPGEGMPTYKNPSVCGNLFLMLTIKFPETLPVENQDALRKLLPPPLLTKPRTTTDDDLEIKTVKDMDPVKSFNDNKYNMDTAGEHDQSESEHEEEGGAHSFFKGFFR